MPIKNRMTSTTRRPRQRRTTMTIAGRQHTRAVTIRQRRSAPAGNRRPRRQAIHQQLRRAAPLHITVKLRRGLHLSMYIGPAWLGLVLSVVVAAWWPQLLPLIRPLLQVV